MNEAHARRLADSYLSLHERDNAFCVVLSSQKEADSVGAAFRQRNCVVVQSDENTLTVMPQAPARQIAAAALTEQARMAC